ncbi:MAG: molybdenum cofactor biosynthesis protein B [Acidimicrobiia bacterium]
MKAAVLTVSDRVTAGSAVDRSGPAVRAGLEALDFTVADHRVVADGVETVAAALRTWVDDGMALIVTTGGTGFSPRDLTPEATREVIDRDAPGIAEAMRWASMGHGPHGMLSRAVSGIAGRTLIINLPGSLRGVEECLAAVGPALRHGVQLVIGMESDHNSTRQPPAPPE